MWNILAVESYNVICWSYVCCRSYLLHYVGRTVLGGLCWAVYCSFHSVHTESLNWRISGSFQIQTIMTLSHNLSGPGNVCSANCFICCTAAKNTLNNSHCGHKVQSVSKEEPRRHNLHQHNTRQAADFSLTPDPLNLFKMNSSSTNHLPEHLEARDPPHHSSK